MFLFVAKVWVLKADFHSSISGDRLCFCNLFFVIDNFYWFGFDHNFLFDLFKNCIWLKNQQSIQKLKVFANIWLMDKLSPVAWFLYFLINVHAESEFKIFAFKLLTYIKPVFHFFTPENTRKLLVSWCFQEV